jgi:hypothetical protein
MHLDTGHRIKFALAGHDDRARSEALGFAHPSVSAVTARSSPARPTSPIAATLRGTAKFCAADATARASATSTPGSVAGSPPAVAAKTSQPLVSMAQRASKHREQQ